MDTLILTNAVLFLSTLSLRRATEQSSSYNAYLAISIHALLAESDSFPGALRATKHKFLSTLSLRRATETLIILMEEFNNFYPRSPCGERPIKQEITVLAVAISIHALLAESDRYRINAR